MSVVGDVWDEAVGTWNWLKSLAYGEFAEDRPTSVIVADMVAAIMIPGAVVATSARDLAAVSLRLGKRYEGVSTDAENAAHPEWQEWVILIASALGVFGPAICAAVGGLVGAMIGDEAAAVIRAVCLLLIEKSGQVLARVVGVLARFTKGNILKLLEKIRFADYCDPLVKNLDRFFKWAVGKIQYSQGLLNKVHYIGRARAVLAELERMETQFYAVQVHAVKQVPQALAKLDEALQELLRDTMPPTYHPAYAGVPAPKPKVVTPSKVRVSPGIGGPAKVLPLLRDGAEASGGAAHGGSVPKPQEVQPESGNVHRKEVKDMTRAEKGVFGEKVSDDFMKAKGYKSQLPDARQMRLLEAKPTGRGIDGVYRKPPGEQPPPYVVTETKYRGDGKTPSLPTTKGSEGYPSAKQMSTRWITDRLPDAVGQVQARDILKAKYESWLMVVDEKGAVVDITKLDKAGNALVDDAGKPIKVSVQPQTTS